MKRCGILTKVFPRWHISFNEKLSRWICRGVRLTIPVHIAHCTCVQRSRLVNSIVHPELLSAPQTHFDFELLRNVFDLPLLLWAPHVHRIHLHRFTCSCIPLANHFQGIISKTHQPENDFVMSIELRWLYCCKSALLFDQQFLMPSMSLITISILAEI